jgi:hypothetical protein
MSWIVTFMAAVLTTLVGVLAGSALGNRSQQRQWSRDRQADACAQVLRESSNVVIELAKLSVQRIEATPDGSSLSSTIDWQPWNEALAMICLVADHDIVEAAQAIDAEIWPVHQVVKRGWIVDADWPRLQRPIEARREDFVNVARRRFAASGQPVRRITGKPAANDPRWYFRRSDFGIDQGQTARDPRPATEPNTTT